MKQSFKKRKVAKQLVNISMLSLAISPIALTSTSVLAETAASSSSVANIGSVDPSSVASTADSSAANETTSETKASADAANSSATNTNLDTASQVAKLSESLDKAIADAKAAGIEVEVDKKVITVQSTEEANAKYDEQAKALTAKLTAYESALKDYEAKSAEQATALKTYEAKLAEVKSQNAKLQSDYDAALKTYQAEKARVDKVNADAKAKYDADLAAYQNATSADAASIKAFTDANNAAKTSLPVASNGYTPTGSTTHLKDRKVGNYSLVSSGDLKSPTLMIKGTSVDKSKIISKLEWGNVAPTGSNLTKGLKAVWDGAYNYNTNGTTNQIWMGKTLTWYKIPGALTMLDGSKHDAYVQFHIDGSGLDSDPTDVAFWNQDGSINALDGWRYAANGAVNDKSDGIRTTIAVDDPTKKDNNYLWSSSMYDIDVGQYLDALKGEAAVLAVGGGMTKNSTDPSKIASDEQLGFSYGVNKGSNALNGRASSPDGTVLFTQLSNQYSTVLRNTPGGNGSAVTRADFGASANIKLEIIEEPTKPQAPTMETLKVNEPTKPTLVAEPEAPKQEELVKPANPELVYNQVRVVNTIWQDENGKVLKDKVEGTHEKGEIKDYIFVETKTDENGNTIHIFKQAAKDASTEKPTEKPKEALPQTNDANLAFVSIASLSSLFAAIAFAYRKFFKSSNK